MKESTASFHSACMAAGGQFSEQASKHQFGQKCDTSAPDGYQRAAGGHLAPSHGPRRASGDDRLRRRLALSLPGRRDSAGGRHLYFLPVDDRLRREIEARLVGEAERAGLVGCSPGGRGGSQSAAAEEDGP